MYPSSSSSSSQKSMGSSGLTRYGSAPSSLLANVVDSVIGSGIGLSSPTPNPHIVGHYFTADSSESSGKVNSSNDPHGFHRHGSYGGSSSLLRQRSSPAGFLDHALTENGFSLARGTKNYNSAGGCSSGSGVSRLKSQLSFTRQDPLAKISEVNEDLVDGVSSNSAQQNGTHSFSSVFGIDAWDNSNSIAFSSQPNKRAKNIDGDIYNCLNGLEPQFGLPQTALEMTAVERMLNIPEDSVPCKIRAKRGCATHPRSIAERERRTRISGKLKKLQDLVPNMDKQTSYADMLDLAVQHIKGLQTEVQKLHQDLDSCTCGCKPSS